MAKISKLGTNTLNETALSGNLNFLSPIGFRFQLQRAPNVEYFCQSVTLATLSINIAPQINSFVDIPRPGDKVTYGEFTMRFRIDEDMTNYLEIHDWVTALGHPDDLSQFKSLTPMSPEKRTEAFLDDVYSDGSIIVLSSNKLCLCFLCFLSFFNFFSWLSMVFLSLKLVFILIKVINRYSYH